MIVYLDTSAFLKLYLEEDGSSLTRQAVRAATATCTHVITYAEMRAALAQAVRMRRLTATQLTHQKACLAADWETLHILPADESLIRRAGDLAETHQLRGFDSVHLAAAERVWRQAPEHFQLAAFDKRLIDTADHLGLARLQ